MSLTVNENEYGLTVSETPTHSLTVSGTSTPLTIASDDLTLTVSDTPTSLLTVTSSTDPSITVQDNNILLTIDQSTGSSSSANPFDQDLNTTDSPTFAAITVSGTVDGRDLSVDGTKLDGIAAQANKYVHPTYTSRSINTSGASVLDEFTSDVAGHVTNITTRTLTLADLGYTGAADANKYVLPTSFTARNINTSGAHVLDTFTSDTSGRVTGITTRPLLLADIGYTGATNADVTPSWVPSTDPNYLTAASTDLDSRYYTETELNSFLALKLSRAGGVMTGNITMSGSETVDGRDLSVDGAKLDGISAGADVTPSWVPSTNPNYLTAASTDLDSRYYTETETDQFLNLKANKLSPVFTGTPSAPTAAAGTNTTQLATTAFVGTAVAGLVDSAPTTLDTLNELAAALGDDANFSTTVTNSIATKLPLAGGTLTGNLILDDGSGDSPTLRFQDGSNIKFNVYAGGASFKITREGNGGADFVITADATDYTDSSLSIGGAVVSPTKIGQWNTAYGWGNHASAGYLTASSTDLDSRYYTETETNSFLNLKANKASPTFTGTITTPNLILTNLSSYSGSDVTALMVNGSNVVGKRVLGSAAFSATGAFAPASHTSATNNPHSVTASQVGLGNVTNESKATMFASPTFTGTVSGVTKTHVGLSNVTNESKATMFASPTFTGTVSGVSKTHVGLGNVTNESKATMFASPAFTGTPTAPTPSLSDNNTNIATTEYVKGQTIAYADLTGKPTIPSGNQIIDWTTDQGSTDIHVNNLPTIPYSSISGTPAAAQIVDWTVDQGSTDIHVGNISEASVTQHQGELSITESQISDLGTYLTASSTDLDSRYYTETETNQFLALKLNLSGGTMAGSIDMGTNDITNAGEIEANEFIGNLRGAVSFTAKAGEALTKGDVVYISGISGNLTVVAKADADNTSKMPAFGVASETVSINANVTIINFGRVSNLDTSGFSEGDELFVSNTAGVLSSTAPSGESSALQKMAKVTRSHASTGSITVMGAGRTNAVPNLNEGRLFVGNSSNQAVADGTVHVDIANSRVGIGTTSPSKKLHVEGITYSTLGFKVANGNSIGALGYNSALRFNNGNILVNNSSAAEFARFDATNSRVGIGTTGPSKKLEVDVGGTSSDGILVVGSLNPHIEAKDSTNSVRTAIASEDSLGKVGTISSTDLKIVTGNSERIRVDTSGNVGIGTTSPTDILTINQTADNNGVRINGYDDESSSYLKMFVDNNGRSRITQNTDGSSGYLFLEAENYLNLTAGTFVYTGDEFRIYDSGQLSLGNGADFKIKYDNSTDKLKIHSSSNDGITMDTSGNVGIGETNPAQKLVVSGSTSISSNLYIGSLSSTGTRIQADSGQIRGYYTTSTDARFHLGRDAFASGSAGLAMGGSGGYSAIGCATNGNDLLFSTNMSAAGQGASAERMRIDSSGNVGIGVTNPSDFNTEANNLVIGTGSGAEGMTIYGGTTGGSYIYFADGTSGSALYEGFLQYRHTERAMRFGVATGVRMTLDSNGRLGIGTTSPVAKLELKGSTADTTANAFVARDSASASLFSIRNDGRVDATGDLVVGGNLTVNGTTSTINSTTLQVDDKNIELGTVDTPTDTTADGGGITLKGATDKTINWVNSTSSWTSNQTFSAPNLTLTNLSSYSGSEVTALMIDGSNIVGKRALGTNAFNSTSFLPLAGGTITGNVRFNDGIKAEFGSSADLQINHDGNQSLIDNGTGHLIIQNQTNDGDIIFKSDDGSGGITEYFRLDGGVAHCYFSKSVIFEDSVELKIGSGNDLNLFHNGTNSTIRNQNQGDLYIENTADDGDIIFRSDNGSGGLTEYFRLDGGLGYNVSSQHLRIADGKALYAGNGNDLGIYHNGTDSYLENTTGHIYIRNLADDKSIIFQNDNGSGGYENYFELQGVSGGASPFTVFPDDSNLVFGNGHDFRLRHNATDSYIDNYTGDLKIAQYADDKAIRFYSDDGSGGLAEYLRLDGGLGYTVASEAIRIADGKALFLGDGEDLGIYHYSNNNYIQNNLGDLIIQNDANDKDIVFKSDNGSGGLATYFKLDGGTTTLQAYKDLLIANDTAQLKFGASQDFKLYHNGSHSYVINNTGDLEIINNTDDGDIKFVSDDGSGGTATYFQLDGGQGQLKVHKNMVFHDSIRARFGTGGDLDVYHDGSNSYAVNNTGDLKFFNHTDDGKIDFSSDNGTGGTATYVSIDGSAVQTRFYKNTRHSDGVIALFGSGNDLQIFHDGSNSYIQDTGTGNFNLQSNSLRLLGADASAMLVAHQGGAVNLYHNNSAKLETTSTGIYVAGNIQLLDSSSTSFGRITFGHGSDLQIFHNGTESNITNATGNFYISQTANDADIIFECDNGSGGVTPYLTLDGSSNGLTVSAPQGMVFFDNIKAKFGNNDDLQIYHDGSHSYIDDIGTGNLNIRNGTKTSIWCESDGTVRLYYNNSTRVQTTTDGIQLYGNGYLDMPDNGRIRMGASYDLAIYHDGNNSKISHTGSGGLYIGADLFGIQNGAHTETYIDATNNGAVNLYYDNSKKLETRNWGISFTGNTVASGSVYAGGANGFVFGSSTSEGEYIYRNGNDIRVFAGGADRLTVDGDDGNVGIGVTDPDAKLEIKGSGTGSGTTLRVRNSSDNELLTVGDNGIVTVPKNYFYVSSGGGAYVQNALRVRGSLLNDQGTLSITGDVSFDSYTLYVDSAYDRVGVGSSSPSYKLDVSGGIRAGGKVTYHKSAASLDTTGYAVAGLTSSYNGDSAGFTFTCYGHTGGYQRIVYACHNVSGTTWNTQKVIDEGTNDFDVAASANGSTITFTFKSRSGTKSYTPRVVVEAAGGSINNTYA